MSTPVDVMVRAGDCPCPGTPHTEEHVFLEPELTLPMAAAATGAINRAGGSLVAVEAAIAEAYIPLAIRSWSFLGRDEKGRIQPVEISRESAASLLPWDRGGLELVEQCDALYSERLMRPLVARMSRLLPSGPTDDSTSPSLPPGPTPQRQSPPSSRNGGAGRQSAARAR